MTPYKTTAHINSLHGEVREVTVLKIDGNTYIVDYNGVKCKAIYNWFAMSLYADDVYEIITEERL